MTVLVAIGHILGSFLVTAVLGAIVHAVAEWEVERNRKQLRQEAAITLGVAEEDLDNEELIPRVVQLSSERFSNELLRNRLSDFCGSIRAAWGWLGFLSQGAAFLAVIWYTVTDSLGVAVNAWFIVALWFFFWITSVAFSLACRLLTGRYPGQAKLARKALAEFLTNRRGNTT